MNLIQVLGSKSPAHESEIWQWAADMARRAKVTSQPQDISTSGQLADTKLHCLVTVAVVCEWFARSHQIHQV